VSYDINNKCPASADGGHHEVGAQVLAPAGSVILWEGDDDAPDGQPLDGLPRVNVYVCRWCDCLFIRRQ
jgi:hypothetical protein